jgi:uncharacterized protein YbjQ (UPF0145 family)
VDDGGTVKFLNLSIPGLALLILAAGCTTGTHKTTGSLGPVVAPTLVTVYYSRPANAQTIGQVSSQSFGGMTYRDASADAMNEIKVQAGKLGANGVLIQDFNTAPLCGAQIHGTAIKVSP